MIDTSRCHEYFEDVLAQAKGLGGEVACQLQEKLAYLGTYACKTGTAKDGSPILDPLRSRCILHKDFVPYSFYFVMQLKSGNEYKDWICGGLIFYGEDEDPCWGVHTHRKDGYNG